MLDDAAVEGRLRLIREEVQEVEAAFASRELAHTAHELCDLLFVVFGAFVELGMNPAHGFRAIADANMQKAGMPRDEFGKVIKPDGFKSADLAYVYNLSVQNGTDVLSYDKLPQGNNKKETQGNG